VILILAVPVKSKTLPMMNTDDTDRIGFEEPDDLVIGTSGKRKEQNRHGKEIARSETPNTPAEM